MSRIASPYRYAVAAGSNRGRPRAQVTAALRALGGQASRIAETPPLGPAARRYANAVAVIDSMLEPAALLARLKAMERAAGRRAGRRWGARVLDLDIVLWSGGRWRSPGLCVPHPRFRERAFVLAPLLAVAPAWRDPVTQRSVRQLHARLTARRPLP